ncbi:MAG TPA: FAD binding domain-containing protein, partial [Anaerolineae bacterium]|nr:FAD binding domain-containing protein [Anaerolineae bacterium]
IMPIEKFFAPDSLDGVLDILNEYGSDALILAGGTMVMPLVNEALTSPRVVLSLQRAGLNTVHANGQIEIGATTTLTRVSQMTDLPLLAAASREIGGWAIRNMATLAGNLFVPPPAGDAAVALLALDAQIVAASKQGERTIPLNQFYSGLMQTALKPNELVTRIVVAKPRGKTAFIKYARREANAPAIVTMAARIVTDPEGVITEARLALGAVNDFPMRAKTAEAALMGRGLNAESIADAAKAAINEAQPFSDALASAWYRKKMVGVYLRRALEQLAANN